MDHAILDQLSETIQNLNQAAHRVPLIQWTPFPEMRPQGAFSLLQDDVEVVLGLMYVKKLDDVWTFKLLHDLDF